MINITPSISSSQPIATAAATPEDKRTQRFKLLKDFYKFLDATQIFRKIKSLENDLAHLYYRAGLEIISRERQVVHVRPTGSLTCNFYNSCISMMFCCCFMYDKCQQIGKEKLEEESSKILDKISPLEKHLLEIYSDRQSYLDDLKKISIAYLDSSFTVQIFEALFDFDTNKLAMEEALRKSPDRLFVRRPYDKYKEQSEVALQGFKSSSSSKSMQMIINQWVNVHEEGGMTYIAAFNLHDRIPGYSYHSKFGLLNSDGCEVPSSHLFYGLLFEARRRQHQKEQKISDMITSAITAITTKDVREVICSYISVSFHEPPQNMTTIVTETLSCKAHFPPEHFVNPPKGSGHLAFAHYIHFTPEIFQTSEKGIL